MATPNLLHLFATAVQVASALSGEMRFADLSAAFKMTCELQQFILNTSFRRKINTNSETLSATQIKTDPDNNTSIPTRSDIQTSDWDGTLPSSPLSSTTDQRSPKEVENRNQTTESSLAPKSNQPSESVQQQPSDVRRQQVTSRCTHPEKRHRMVALETLHPDQVQIQTRCEACRLRMGSSVESFATMACPACPNQPAICSAQCFRWWHNRFPELLHHDHSNMCSQQDNSLEEISRALLAFPFPDTSVTVNAVNKLVRPVRGHKNRRRNLQLSTVKRAGLRKRYGRRQGVLRDVRTAVSLDTSIMAYIYEQPKTMTQVDL